MVENVQFEDRLSTREENGAELSLLRNSGIDGCIHIPDRDLLWEPVMKWILPINIQVLILFQNQHISGDTTTHTRVAVLFSVKEMIDFRKEPIGRFKEVLLV
jgi:hypothetical protein